MVETAGEERHGLPNDWDLNLVPNTEDGFRPESPDDVYRQRTGMGPLMALATITPYFWAGRVEREYVFELESFVWILPWVFLQHEEPDAAPVSRHFLPRWFSSEYEAARFGKEALLDKIVQHPEQFKPAPRFEREWQLGDRLLVWVDSNRINRMLRLQAARRGKPLPKQSDSGHLEDFWVEVMAVVDETTDGYFDFIRPFREMIMFSEQSQ